MVFACVFSVATIFGTIALLVLREQRQPVRHLRDAGDRGDLRRSGLLERQLRAGQEEVVHEVRARLAELREVGDHRLVRLHEIAARAAARPPGPPPPNRPGSAAARASPSDRCRCPRAG